LDQKEKVKPSFVFKDKIEGVEVEQLIIFISMKNIDCLFSKK